MDNYPLLNIFWTLLMFFGLVLWIWLVISVFMDNFRRNDHGGWAKAGWTVLIICVPLIGVLAYMIARPKMTEQDKQLMKQYELQQKALQGATPSQEIARLNDLKEKGAISSEEYDKLKTQVLAA